MNDNNNEICSFHIVFAFIVYQKCRVSSYQMLWMCLCVFVYVCKWVSESSSLCALMPSVLCVERGAPSNAVVLHNLTLAVSVSVSVDTDSGCEHVTFVQKHYIVSLSFFPTFGRRNVLRFFFSIICWFFTIAAPWNAIFSYKFKQTNYFQINWNSPVNSTGAYCELWFVARCQWQLRMESESERIFDVLHYCEFNKLHFVSYSAFYRSHV